MPFKSNSRGVGKETYKGEIMNDQTRKLLTEYLGECWDENEKTFPYKRETNSHGESITVNRNRSFTTPDDADALRRKMVEKGDWADFIDYAYINNFKTIRIMSEAVYDFINWLIEPTHFCELAGEFITRKEK